MVDRESLLELAGSKHARAIYEQIRTDSEGMQQQAYYNKLCRDLRIPSATVNKYLYLLHKNNIIQKNWQEIEVTETLKKGMRHRKIWVRVIQPSNADERRIFESLLYGKA